MTMSSDDKNHRIYAMSFAALYPLYIAKAERKGRTKEEVDKIIHWLTGYSQTELETVQEKETDLKTFFAEVPRLNPSRNLIKRGDRKSTRLNSSHVAISYAVFCLKKK